MSAKKSANDKQAAKKGRDERLAALRKEQQSAERRRSFILYGAAALAIAIIAGAVFWAIYNERQQPDGRTATGSIDGVQEFDYTTGNHVPGTVDYAETPPVGGDHNQVWLNCGVYRDPVPNENAVHSLEHGAVWITYQPDLPADQVEELESLTPSTYGLISPFEGLDSPIAISSWSTQLKVDSADDPRLKAFIEEYRQGPKTPEPGAACTGGVGEPVS